MSSLTTNRIKSIDLLKGLVMIIMALDHVRDYFHAPAFLYDPADPTHTTLPIFFTRWITHFCAPTFSFLAGLSAFMVGRRKAPKQLSKFLLTRGLWLVVIELTIVNFAWYFDPQFRTFGLLVIWSLGVSMIVLAALVYLPQKIILLFSCLLIFGHNLLDNVHYDGSLFWAIIHDQKLFTLSENTELLAAYPIVPWIAVMALGYYFGRFYDPPFDSAKRKKLYNIIGLTALLLFVILRWINSYGDPLPWTHYGTLSKDLVSFLNPSKYPPSLMYLLMTLGAALLVLANTENLKGRMVDFFCTFGRVPFFYYILHLYLIHIVALIFAQLSGWGWEKFILPTWIGFDAELKGYGFPLWVVYVVWVGVIIFLYPFCKMFDKYKMKHREKWWLSYL